MKTVFYKDKWSEESLRKLGLSGRQIKALLYAKDQGKITNKEYRNITGLSDEGARIDLKELGKKGLLQIEGKGRSTHYILFKIPGD